MRTAGPAHFGVRKKFWLSGTFSTCAPYESAITTLQTIESCPSSYEKLQCLLKVNSQIHSSIIKYWEGHIADLSDLVMYVLFNFLVII